MRHVPGAPIATAKLPPVSRIELVNHAANRSATPRSRGRPPNPPDRTHHDSARTGHRIRRILWIDDEFDRDKALTRLLGFEGFRIDIVGSATDGLAKAEAGSYDGIVLDLRLPDMFGLSVLKRLVADKNAAPVLVVTGYYHEPEIEADALRAGAAAFRHKPLIIDDLTAVLCLIVNRPVHSEAVVQRSEPVAVGISLSEIPGPPALAVSPSSRRARIFALSRKLADPSGTTLEFVTTAGMLRRMLKGWRGTDRPLGPIDVLPRDVRMVIQYLELKVRSRCVLLEADLESKLAMHSGDSGRLLTLHTGAGYREWRRALRLRPAVHPLAFSDEHIRQIAYRIGYEHPSQFDRDFYQAFGLTPTDYRWLCKAARS